MKAPSAWFWLLLTLVVIGLMIPFWTGHVPAFRDGLHYYYPQYRWLQHCYDQGQYFPAWCSAEGLGIAPTGQPAWQLFYPLRATWLIPSLTLPQKYGLFLSIHLMIAAAGAWRLAGTLRLTPPARALAAVSYTLSCPVVFQYCNPIYLCSAAWIGWSLIPISRLTSQGSSGCFQEDLRWLLTQLFQLLCFAGLMLLGGDPHNAVNLAIISLPLVTIKIRKSFSGSERPKCQFDCHPTSIVNTYQVPELTHDAATRVLRYAAVISGLILLSLAAAQVICTYRWLQHSVRANRPFVRSDSFQPTINSILTASQSPSSLQVYDFSLSPWSLPTAWWPHWTGHYQPDHSRWTDCIGSESRMWIPSLYFGLIPFGLALFGWRKSLRNNSMAERYLAIIAMMALLAALGNYSPGWALREILHSMGLDQWERLLPSDSRSSLYGLLTLIIPGYDKFRYPAKWLVWTIACVSVLAARQMDTIETRRPASFSSTGLKAFLGLSFLGLILSWPIQFDLFHVGQWLQSRLNDSFDRLLGTAQFGAVISTWRYSMVWPIVIVVSCVCLRKCCPQPWMRWGVVFITLLDLSLCSRWWITTTESTQFQSSVPLHETSQDRSLVWANPARADIRNLSVNGAATLQTHQIAIQQTFLWNKLGMISGNSMFHASDSLEPHCVRLLKNWIMVKDDMSPTQPELDSVLAHLGVTHRLVATKNLSQNPLHSFWEEGSGISSREHQFRWQPVSNAGELCELVVSNPMNEPSVAASTSSLHWQWQNCQTLEVDVQLETSATLIVRQYNDGNWKVRDTRNKIVDPRSGELFLVMDLPTGDHRLIVSR